MPHQIATNPCLLHQGTIHSSRTNTIAYYPYPSILFSRRFAPRKQKQKKMEGRTLADFRNWLAHDYEMPPHITPENINHIDVTDTYYSTVLEAAVHCHLWTELIPQLLDMGAHVTLAAISYVTLRSNHLRLMLEAGADPNMSRKDGVSLLSMQGTKISHFMALLDYGCKIPADLRMRALTPEHYQYAERIRSRERACRRALVAMVAYCRRSKYAALRAAYRELAKCMLRMRGPAGCGPRAEKWEF